MNLHLKYEQDVALTLDFFKAYYNKRGLKVLRIFFIVMLTISILAQIMVDGFTTELFTSWGFPMIVVFFILIILWPQIMRWQVKRALQQNKFGSSRELLLSEEEIVLKTQASESTFKWEGILKTGQSKLSHFLYIAKNQAIIIPKMAMTGEEEEQLLELLRVKGLQ